MNNPVIIPAIIIIFLIAACNSDKTESLIEEQEFISNSLESRNNEEKRPEIPPTDIWIYEATSDPSISIREIDAWYDSKLPNFQNTEYYRNLKLASISMILQNNQLNNSDNTPLLQKYILEDLKMNHIGNIEIIAEAIHNYKSNYGDEEGSAQFAHEKISDIKENYSLRKDYKEYISEYKKS